MGHWKLILKKLLLPGRGWVFLAVLLGGTSLTLTFLVFGANSPFAYVSYLLSAYGLMVLAAATILLFRSARQAVHRVPLAHRYITDRYFKVHSSLVLSLLIDLCYAGFKLACAVRYISLWDGALAVYHILLCIMRVYLIRRIPTGEQERDMGRELKYYRSTGVFLFALDVALSGVAAQIVRYGYGSNYPGMLIYVAAAHAFYSLTIAVINTIKYRKFPSPVLSAAKAVSLTTALVSMLNLETAMLAQFGEGDAHFRLIMTACTAFFVSVIILGAAAYMVISSTCKIRRLFT